MFDDSIELATQITIAWLSNPNTKADVDDVSALLKSAHAVVNDLTNPSTVASSDKTPTSGYVPAITAKKSLASPDHIISMIDGKPYRTLKRHLSFHGLTPEQYRQRYNLKFDYPTVAPSYSEQRRAMAKHMELGRKPGQKVGRKA